MFSDEAAGSGHAKERLRKPRLMSQSKREQVVSHLRYIRQELREMHQGVMEDGLLPEAGEWRDGADGSVAGTSRRQELTQSQGRIRLIRKQSLARRD